MKTARSFLNFAHASRSGSDMHIVMLSDTRNFAERIGAQAGERRRSNGQWFELGRARSTPRLYTGREGNSTRSVVPDSGNRVMRHSSV